ncbi:MAG TPA: ATP-binding protein [Candidatus Eremiobacteraceae bacterium]|nr:ATP-binding protein [Candidatus Eremiobacteraceae bacterium]
MRDTSIFKNSRATRRSGGWLRGQPREDGLVTIARAAVSVTFPSRFMLAAAMNPCPCSYFGDPRRECHCTAPMIQRYVSKISGPLLDRIDIHIEVPAVKYKELRAPSSAEDSAAVRRRVIAAREIQAERFKGEKRTYCNAQMASKLIRKCCAISQEGEKLLENAVTRLGLSARAHDRILKVARTIADLEGAADIQAKHLSEAIQYRTLDRSYWA